MTHFPAPSRPPASAPQSDKPEPGSGHPGSRPEEPTAPVGSGANSSFLVGSTRQNESVPVSIDRYRVIRVLGRGGMGVVYLAKRSDETISVPVALKVLKRGLDTDHILKRFNLERQLLGALNHPYIARLFDAGCTKEGLPFLVMEYVEGEALDRHCESNQLDIAQRLRLFQKVCAGVHALHQNLVVHRDLKPSNILVTTQGEPKLLDLGIAKLVNPVLGGLAEQTIGEHQLMTPEYASPEQVTGRAITTSSDIYALGMILYELLSGERAYRFESRSNEEIRRVVCDVDPEKPSTRVSRALHGGAGRGTTLLRSMPTQRLARALEGDLDDIVMMALEKVPSRRYASAQDLADDIGRYLSDEPVRARRTSRRSLYRAAKFVHRNRKTVAFGTAGVLALAVSAGVAALGWRNAAVAGEQEAKQRTLAQQAAREAERQRDVALAERSAKLAALQQSVQASSRLLDTYEKLANEIDEPTDDLGELVRGALETTEKARALAPEVPGLDALLAECHEKAARLNFNPDKPHLGRVALADAGFRECLALRERLFAQSPGDTKSRLDLWQTYRFAAQAAQALGEPSRALDLITRSQEFAEAGEEPGRTPGESARRNAQRGAVSLATRAWILRDLGRHREAIGVMERSVQARRDLGVRDPARLSPDELMGEFLLSLERPEDALPLLRANLDEASTLTDSARTRRRTANARFMLGDALARTGDRVRGIELMQRAIADTDLTFEGGELLPVKDTSDYRRLANRAEMQGRLGRALLDAGRHAEALSAFGMQTDLAARLVTRDERYITARLARARGLSGLSQALSALGRREEALRAASAAIDEALIARDRAPELHDARRALAWAYAAASELHPPGSAERRQALSDAMKSLGDLVASDDQLPGDAALVRRAVEAR